MSDFINKVMKGLNSIKKNEINDKEVFKRVGEVSDKTVNDYMRRNGYTSRDEKKGSDE